MSRSRASSPARRQRAQAFVYIALLLAGIVYLANANLGHRIETDVSSLLPREDSEAARLARELVNETQGRALYLRATAMPSDPDEREEARKVILDAFSQSPRVESAAFLESLWPTETLSFVAENRIPLLFPKWLRDRHSEYEVMPRPPEEAFVPWAVNRAIEALDRFSESPEALELSDPDLLDPLLLLVEPLQSLALAGPSEESDQTEDLHADRFWIRLASSPFSIDTQREIETLVGDVQQSLDSTVDSQPQLAYGGLTRLAQASRERIVGDIYQVNALSLSGVILVAWLLLGRPWQLLRVAPVVLAAAIGALCASFAIHPSLSILVLAIGSILIGISIDYGFHAAFAPPPEQKFPTKRLIGLACFSTAAGFSTLALSNVDLIRQIGIFVASGLVAALLAAWLLVTPAAIPSTSRLASLEQLPKRHRFAPYVTALFGLFFLVALSKLVSADWNDSIQNFEPKNPQLLAEDMALRSHFHTGGQGQGAALLSLGASYLEALDRQAKLAERLEADGAAAGFRIARFAPTESEIDHFHSFRQRLPIFLDSLSEALERNGYVAEAFGDFFAEAQALPETFSSSEPFEALTAEFRHPLPGPLEGLLGGGSGYRWAVMTVDGPADAVQAAIDASPRSFLLSEMQLVDDLLDRYRLSFARFGIAALALISLVVLAFIPLKQALLTLSATFVATATGMGVAAFVHPTLGLFHLIGGLLGAAIALDYALFAFEGAKRGKGLPFSVVLSASTTSASFLALSTSGIFVLQSLGLTVLFVVASSALALLALRALLVDGPPQPRQRP